MIHQLQINNFESHEHTDIELSPGVNVFIGSTDSGKSSIIRALKWLLANRPLGDSFRSHWGGDTSVVIGIDDLSINRNKGKSPKDNYYKISNIEKPLEAPGTSVPEPVFKALNIEEINTQYQLDHPFLLLNTPGEVAKYLNKIVNWEKIDRAQSWIKSRKNEINRDIKSKTNDLEIKKETLKKFDYIDDFETDLKALEKKYSIYTGLKEQYTKLYKTYQQVEFIQQEIEDNKKNYPPEKEIDNLLLKIKQVQELKKSFNDLNSSLAKARTLQKMVKEKSELKKSLENQYKKLAPETCPLCDQEWKNKNGKSL